MNRKNIVVGLVVLLLLLFVDSKFNLLVFKEKPNSTASNNCRVVDELKNLNSAINSKDYKNIATSLKRLQFRLTIAYGLETGLAGLGSKSKSPEASKLSIDLDSARKEFGKFNNLNENEIVSNIPKIQESLNKAEKTLKSSC